MIVLDAPPGDQAALLRGVAWAAGHRVEVTAGWLDGRLHTVDWDDPTRRHDPPPQDCVRALTPTRAACVAFTTAAGYPTPAVRRPTWWGCWVDWTFARVTCQEVTTCHVTPAGVTRGTVWEVTIPLTALPAAVTHLRTHARSTP